jgi:hypothetical protein
MAKLHCAKKLANKFVSGAPDTNLLDNLLGSGNVQMLGSGLAKVQPVGQQVGSMEFIS